MITQLLTIQSTTTDSVHNLAVESVLLTHCPADAVILYLWQNARTVVIGRNQNAWKECHVTRLEESGGHLVRRPSGGGAVYHDLGNLNFTFLAAKENYDICRQNSVIIRALRRFGIEAERSGRNDLLAEGKKFSGTAYYSHGANSYEHGTLMVNVDKDEIAKYLNVSVDKLKSKGVSSVRARVCNLVDLAPQLTVEALRPALIDAAAEEYSLIPRQVPEALVPAAEVAGEEALLASWEWIFGKAVDFTNTLAVRFPWGGIELALKVDAGSVREGRIYSDALRPDMIETLTKALTGVHYQNKAMAEAVSCVEVNDSEARVMRDEVAQWLLTAAL